MYLIIGASSFIGVHTAEVFLKLGCSILVTGRCNKFRDYYEKKGVGYLNLDLEQEQDFEKLPTDHVEGVILLGGLLPANARANLREEENGTEYISVNTMGTLRVLEYCRKNHIPRMISTTSYGEVSNSWGCGRALTEEEPRGFSFSGDHAAYIISKNAACDMIEYYNCQHGMKNVVFRLPPVYGVGPHGSLFVNGVYQKSGLWIFMEQASRGEDITIFGDPNLSRDVVYVKDVARALYLAMRSEKASGLYNMSSGKGVTLREQAEVIAHLFAPDPAHISKLVYRPEVKNQTPSYLFSMEKAKKDFGFVPEYSQFQHMMEDYKKDLDQGLYRELFHYGELGLT